MDTKQINQKIKDIPPHLIPEVLDYIEFLIQKHKYGKKQSKSFDFKWGGALADLSGEFTSVQLQHKTSEWR